MDVLGEVARRSVEKCRRRPGRVGRRGAIAEDGGADCGGEEEKKSEREEGLLFG